LPEKKFGNIPGLPSKRSPAGLSRAAENEIEIKEIMIGRFFTSWAANHFVVVMDDFSAAGKQFFVSWANISFPAPENTFRDSFFVTSSLAYPDSSVVTRK